MLNDMNNPKEKSLSVTQRGEPQRSGGEPNGVTDKQAEAGRPADPEVLAQPKHRQLTAEYKARIVEEAQRSTESGQIGSLLRREGLYSSALTLWRRQYQNGALQGLKDDKRGRKRTRDARDLELDHLRRENDRLSKKLRHAELIIDIQKKVAAMLGNPIETPTDSEGNS
jgi:transposase